jgi:hypothetical protein
MPPTREAQRLADADAGRASWRRWGTYLSERAWGTVREDYSAGGDSWDYFPHDHARSRAYRWSEDGIGGWCDEKQHLCLAVALWNEHDPILKERMFGLTNAQGNHGEDVKEYYFYLDGTPTHSYMKMLYKYPHAAYPYAELVEVNGRIVQDAPEFELFDALREEFLANRYFDVFVEYAKASPEDVLCRITVYNRGAQPAPIHVLPHLWYRNTWTWETSGVRPAIRAAGDARATTSHPIVGDRWWAMRCADGSAVELLFTENETNFERIDNFRSGAKYAKDGINDAIVAARRDCVNAQQGSKMAGHVRSVVAPDKPLVIEVRLSDSSFSREPKGSVEAPKTSSAPHSLPVGSRLNESAIADPFADFDSIFAARIAEADEFYADKLPKSLSDDERLIARQALGGLLWSKQYYHYDVYRWLLGDPTEPTPPAVRWQGRNHTWKQLHNADVILMPDAWEYPWYAAWDLSFHCVAMARIDVKLAKQQLLRMGHEWYQHASGQYPAYEWNFDDVNPPVIGWAAWRVYQIEQEQTGQGDVEFLQEIFQNEMLNFSFWVNRKDSSGRDIFGGGFLGMDNIGCFNRDEPLPSGEQLEQSDGTSWMALHCITLLSMSLELARHDAFYQNMASKYFEHFLYIAHAMTNMCGEGIHLWDDEDEFFYDVVHTTDGHNLPLKIRSMVGLVSLFAVVTAHAQRTAGLDVFIERAGWFLRHRPDLLNNVSPVNVPARNGTRMMAILSPERLTAVLRRMLDPQEFLSDYGVRALSRYHLEHPYVFDAGGQQFVVKYLPGESDSRLFGGNSNWRGPIWFPVNYMIIHALREYYRHYEDGFKVECPTGSGQQMNLNEVALDLIERLVRIFARDSQRGGRRAVWGDNDYFQTDPQWRDHVPFHEYFHGDTGQGLGASHQTGWTSLVVSLLFEREEWSEK